MSSDLLREAASRLERLADACPTNTAGYQHLCAFLARGGGTNVGQPTARWWAAMNPQTATPLVAWLRDSANALDGLVDEWASTNIARPLTPQQVHDKTEVAWRNQLAFARLVLGEQA
jgi:hypothetical protein